MTAMFESFAAAAVWGVLIIFAFIGWGGEIERRLFATRTTDAGLRGAWGMAFALFLTGVLALFSLSSKPVILAFVAAGIVLGVFDAVRRARHNRPFAGLVARWGGGIFIALVAVAVAAALLQYLDSICDIRFNIADDYIAYFPFAKQIVQRGTLFDPFNTRLAMAFGGQSFLHAIVLAGAPSFRLHLLDQGICMLMAVLLVIGGRKKDEPAWPTVLALLVLVTLPHVKINTHSQFSGVVLFYGLYRTVLLMDERSGTRRTATAAIISLVAVAACTLRANFLAAAIPMVGLSYAHAIWKAGPDRKDRIREMTVAAALGLLFLAPWMILAFRSAGTPLYPLIRGHFNDAFPMLQRPTNFRQELADLRGTLVQNTFLPALPLFVLAGVLLPDSRSRTPLRALLLSAAVGWVALIAALASDIPSFLRYVYGFVVALALAVIARCAAPTDSMSETQRARVRLGKAAAIIGAITQLFMTAEHSIQLHGWMLDRVIARAGSRLQRPERTPVGREHEALQSHVPPGERLLIMLDFPYMLDYSRNAIFNIDTAAAISPPPGFPYFQGSESVARYLRQVGIRYVAFVRPDQSVYLFSRKQWEKELRGTQPLWHAQAPIFLDMFSNFDQLAASYKVLYETPSGLVVLDLAQPHPRSTSAAVSPPRL
jgi:hypothetical protein